MATSTLFHDKQYSRLEAKLRAEPGEPTLSLFGQENRPDILLNPASSLCLKSRPASLVADQSMAIAAAFLGIGAEPSGHSVESATPDDMRCPPVLGSRRTATSVNSNRNSTRGRAAGKRNGQHRV